MIPCYSLFLEVEVPDPSLNYFIISQHETENTEKLLAPPPLGVPTRTRATSNVVQITEESGRNSWGEPYGGLHDEFDPDQGANLNGIEIRKHLYSGNEINTDGTFGLTIVNKTSDPAEQNITLLIEWGDGEGGGGIGPVSFEEVSLDPVPYGDVRQVIFSNPQQPNLQISVFTTTYNPEQLTWNNAGVVCEPSGLNTFVLSASCLDGDVDLLEGWGAARPDYKWVDVITDTTDINIARGFDMKQGVVGTPIAGVMEATIVDPYLEGIETSKVAVGQRVRLRAGREIVFSGVANSVRSEYDAVNTPILRIEAVDALGLLNAQMVSERPQENYNTRIAEAASKVELPIVQQDSTTELNPTEDPMSALELLVETQDSEGSVVWLDRYGTLYSTNRYWLDTLDLPVLRNSRFGEPPRFTFTNNPGNPDYEIGIGALTQDVCMSSYKQVSDTSQVINGITFYNFVEEDDVDFEGLPVKTIVRDTYTFESANSRRLYGDAGVKLTTYLNPTDLVGYADYIFANYDTPKTKVETIQFPLDKWKSLEVPAMVSIDIGDPVNVRVDDPNTSHTLNNATQRVAQIRHRITPTEWLCELDLL